MTARLPTLSFFDGSTAIGAADTATPFSRTWTPSTTGVHMLTARATDDRGGTTTSAALRVTINASTSDTQPPTVTIVEPVALADNLTGMVTFRAEAVDNVGVANVEFQVDGVAPGLRHVGALQRHGGHESARRRAARVARARARWCRQPVRLDRGDRALWRHTRNTRWHHAHPWLGLVR